MHKLMYMDTPVLEFDTEKEEAKVLNKELLPFNVQNKENPWDMIRTFCSSRMLMTNREYCKEILTACEIDDQTDVNICIVSKALSFRDNYWIKENDSKELWKDVNLYENEFSEDIAVTSLTGEIEKTVHIGDQLYTGELTNKGTRAKCFVRGEDGSIWLAKAEKREEILAEIISGRIAEVLHLPHTNYQAKNIYGTDCSFCKIQTSPEIELIPARDILQHFRSDMAAETPYYNLFVKIGGKDFLKMQVFDIITLNIDRNRDNFALQKEKEGITKLYPIFDHDSCFKGKSLDGIYFPTRMTFRDSLDYLCERFPKRMQEIAKSVHRLEKELEKGDMRDWIKEYMGDAKLEMLVENTAFVEDRIGRIRKREKEWER